MKSIPLTKGRFAIVDDDDYDRVVAYGKWHFTNIGYAYDSHNKPMHRFIAGTPDDKHTDHINGDRLDNRKENLRVCSRSENNQNKGISGGNSSGYKGVSWSRQMKKWDARIMSNGERIFLGLFDKKEDAAKSYDDAAKKLHGKFARTNFR